MYIIHPPLDGAFVPIALSMQLKLHYFTGDCEFDVYAVADHSIIGNWPRVIEMLYSLTYVIDSVAKLGQESRLGILRFSNGTVDERASLSNPRSRAIIDQSIDIMASLPGSRRNKNMLLALQRAEENLIDNTRTIGNKRVAQSLVLFTNGFSENDATSPQEKEALIGLMNRGIHVIMIGKRAAAPGAR